MSKMGFNRCVVVNIPTFRPVPPFIVDRFHVQIPDQVGPFQLSGREAEVGRLKKKNQTKTQDLRMFSYCIIKRFFFSFWFIYAVSAASYGNEMELSICPPICMLSSMGLHYPRGWSIGQIFIDKILKQKIKFSTESSSFPDKCLLFSTTNFTFSFFWPKNIWLWCIHAGYRRKGLSFGWFFLLPQPYHACLYFVCLGCVTSLYLPVQTPGRQHFSFGNF